MEPATVEQQQQQKNEQDQSKEGAKQESEFSRKVNEMQNCLPSLKQMLAKAMQQKQSGVNEEELQKLKLLHELLCGGCGSVVDDGQPFKRTADAAVDNKKSFSLEDLDKYAVMLRKQVDEATTSCVEMSTDKHDIALQSTTKENTLTNGGSVSEDIGKNHKDADTIETPSAGIMSTEKEKTGKNHKDADTIETLLTGTMSTEKVDTDKNHKDEDTIETPSTGTMSTEKEDTEKNHRDEDTIETPSTGIMSTEKEETGKNNKDADTIETPLAGTMSTAEKEQTGKNHKDADTIETHSTGIMSTEKEETGKNNKDADTNETPLAGTMSTAEKEQTGKNHKDADTVDTPSAGTMFIEKEPNMRENTVPKIKEKGSMTEEETSIKEQVSTKMEEEGMKKEESSIQQEENSETKEKITKKEEGSTKMEEESTRMEEEISTKEDDCSMKEDSTKQQDETSNVKEEIFRKEEASFKKPEEGTGMEEETTIKQQESTMGENYSTSETVTESGVEKKKITTAGNQIRSKDSPHSEQQNAIQNNEEKEKVRTSLENQDNKDQEAQVEQKSSERLKENTNSAHCASETKFTESIGEISSKQNKNENSPTTEQETTQDRIEEEITNEKECCSQDTTECDVKENACSENQAPSQKYTNTQQKTTKEHGDQSKIGDITATTIPNDMDEDNLVEEHEENRQLADDEASQTDDDFDEMEYEGEVELIKIPEDVAEDEMILPDSADEADFEPRVSDAEEEEEEQYMDDDQVEELNADNDEIGKEAKKTDKVEVVEKEQLEITKGKRMNATEIDKTPESGNVQKTEDRNDSKTVVGGEVIVKQAVRGTEDESTETNKNEGITESVVEKSPIRDVEDTADTVDTVQISSGASVHEQEETTRDSSGERTIPKAAKESDDDDGNASNSDVEAIEESNCETDDQNSNLLPAEIAMDSSNARGEVITCDDPLAQAENGVEDGAEEGNATENQKTKKVAEVANRTQANAVAGDDDDDDDVEIIETRNSPICLDTDDDDDDGDEMHQRFVRTGANKIATANDRNKRTISITTSSTRTTTRTTTTNKTMTAKKPPPSTETIELLDDSSDEERNWNGNRRRGRNMRYAVRSSLCRIPTQQQEQKQQQPSQSQRGRKRTLLPRVQQQGGKTLKISQVLSGAAVPANYRAYNNKASSTTTKSVTRRVLLLPPTSFTPTPQSNFLNAVNLQPTAAATSGDNPLAFSAKLSNKNIIIPNAFYANRQAAAEKDVATTKTTASADKVKAPTAATSSSASSSVGVHAQREKPQHSSPSTTTTSKVQTVMVTEQQERIYRLWLDDFIAEFANAQRCPSHSCLVLLQNALKYKTFARIKDLRTELNTKTYTSQCAVDRSLMRELQNVFYSDGCRRLTNEGFRFCAAACTQMANNVTLMTNAISGRIAVRTCPYNELLAKYGGTTGSGSGDENHKRKRQKGDEEEYTPAKYYEKKQEDGEGSGEGRRKSLRQHRTRCYDETYLYEQAEAEAEAEAESGEPDVPYERSAMSNKRRQEEQMRELVQRKAEEKRLEAKRQREQQVKSFESAYLEMFAKSLRGRSSNENSESATSSRSKDNKHTKHIIIDDDDDDNAEDDDEPRSHRIYKVVPTQLLAAQQYYQPQYNNNRISNDDEDDTSGSGVAETITSKLVPAKGKRGRPRKQTITTKKGVEPELITCDSASGESSAQSAEDVRVMAASASSRTSTDREKAPKNTNVNWHAGTDWCHICNKRVVRTVVHYVNEHPNHEVYISRIPKANMARLRKHGGQIVRLRPYLNGQEQYEAECVFCDKTCCFKMSYWYQHYSIHTGEYAYRCSGCNIRKPTRSAMTVHINQPCPKRGKLLEDFTYNSRPKYIEVRVCKLCNFTQLNGRNVLEHLRRHHGAAHTQKKNVESVVLLRLPEPDVEEMLDDAKEFLDLGSSSGDGVDGGIGENSYQTAMTFNYDNFNEVDMMNAAAGGGMWDDGDPTDDLSYMICGMLDVQMRNDDDDD